MTLLNFTAYVLSSEYHILDSNKTFVSLSLIFIMAPAIGSVSRSFVTVIQVISTNTIKLHEI